MTGRKVKTWKRILVLLLTFAIIAGNLSSQAIVVKAAESGDVDNLEQIYNPDTETGVEPEQEKPAEEPEQQEDTVQVIENEGNGYVISQVGDEISDIEGEPSVVPSDGNDAGENKEELTGSDVVVTEVVEGTEEETTSTETPSADDSETEVPEVDETEEEIQNTETEELEEAEEPEEEQESIVVKAVCVDEEDRTLPGYGFTVKDTIAFDAANVPEIDGYTYVEAKVDNTVITGVEVAVDEDGTVLYTIAGEEDALTENTTVMLCYEKAEEYKEPAINVVAVDTLGKAIDAEATLPDFLGTLELGNVDKVPCELEGYDYVEATINGTVIDALVRQATETEKDDVEDRAFVWSYVAGGETIDITEDTTITLVYEEKAVAIKLTATIIDEFGDEIGNKYKEMKLPIFDESGILTLDDEGNPPYEKVVIKKLFRKAITYTYVRAMLDDQIISAIKQIKIENSSDYGYAYTTDGATWVLLKEDADLSLVYSDGKKTVYTYEDASVNVVATLQHANAIPDNAEFKVTPIAKESAYDYEAYMSALNASDLGKEDGKQKRYDDTNTLLYDIAFLAEEVDEEGNGTGNVVEYQPAEGMVNIAISFKNRQLEEEIGAEKEENVTIIHMPLSDSVKASSNSTADAGDLSASDIQVEVVNAAVSVAGEAVDFNLANFSAVVIVSDGKTTIKPGTSVSYEEVLGNASQYGLVANEMTLAGHLESNFAVGTLHGNADIQSCRNDGGGAGYTYIGEYTGDNMKMTLNGNAGYLKIYTTEDALKRFGFNMTHMHPGEGLDKLQLPDGVIVDYSSKSEKAIKNMVAGMVSATASMSNTLWERGQTEGYDFKKIKQEWSNDIDIASLGTSSEGTYYINFAAGEFPVTNYTIKLKAGQNVVLNIPDESVSFGLFKVNIDGREYTTQGTYGEQIVCEKVIFNCPNAKTSQTSGPSTGTFLVPNSTFTNNSVAAGYLVANVIAKVGGQEWHSINKGMPIVNPTSFTLNAKKYVDDKTVAQSENGKFTFALYACDDRGNAIGDAISSVTNQGSEVIFKTFSNIKTPGTYWYVIKEEGQVEGYTIDTTLYYAKVVVSSVTEGYITDTNAMVEYYESAKDGEKVPIPVFNNRKNFAPCQVVLGGKKTINGAAPSGDEKFTFELYPYTKNDKWGNLIESVQNNGETFSFSPMTFDGKNATTITEDGNEAYYYFLVKEKVNNDKYVYDKTQYIAKVILTKGATAWEPTVKYFKFDEGQEVSCKKTAQLDQGTIVDSMTFHNGKALDKDDEYEFKVTKLLKNVKDETVEWPAGATFTFRLEAIAPGDEGEGNHVTKVGPLPEKTEVTVSAENPTASFGKVKFPEIPSGDGWVSGAYEGTRYHCYMYKITEVIPDDGHKIPGVTYDGKTQYIKIWHNTMRLNQVHLVDTWIEVNGSTSLAYCGGALTDIEFVNHYNQPKTSVTVEKRWEDFGNQDGKRPAEVTISLYADGEPVEGKTATVKADENWRYTFTDLPKYKADGKTKIVYIVKETNAPSGYTPSYSKENNGTLVIVNTYKPEKIKLSGSKIWVDDNNRDGVRPDSITVRLWKGGNVIASKVVTEKENWKWSFDNLDRYENGTVIEYTVTEDTIPGEIYTTTVGESETDDAGNITIDIVNQHNPGKTNISVQKMWADGENRDGFRPTNVKVALYRTVINADGTVYADKEPAKIKDGESNTSDAVILLNEDNNWTYTWSNLPVKEAGRTIRYSVEEVEVPKGYTATYSGNETTIYITNTHTPELTEVSGSKVWNDAGNQDGLRPAAIQIELWRKDKTDAPVQSMEVKPDADGKWNFKFEELPKYEAGRLIEYYVKEVEVPGYTTSVSNQGNVWTLTNTHTPALTEVNGSKTWEDDGDRDGVRPSKITVKLWDGGSEAIRTLEAGEENNWEWAFTNLPKFRAGEQIKYYVTEDYVDGYTTSVSDPVADKETGYITSNITNTHTPGKTGVSVKKVWVDDNNRDNVRPSGITVQLYKALKNNDNKFGTAVPAKDKDGNEMVVTLEESNQWQYSWMELPAKESGKEIRYTVDETEIPDGYVKSVTGDMTQYVITNTHESEKTSITVNKEWADNENQDGKRPESITFELYSETEGIVVATQKVKEEDSWTYTFTNLPKKLNGTDIVYKVREVQVEYYTSEVSQINENTWKIVNNHDTEQVEVHVQKKWEDDNNRDGVRPSQITVKLLDGENVVREQVIVPDSEGNWEHTFTELPKYRDGVEIKYTITEESVSDYSTRISDAVSSEKEDGTKVTSFEITNTHTPDKTGVSVEKVWVDGDNRDGLRNEDTTISVQLYKKFKNAADAAGNNDPVPVGEAVTLGTNNNWKFTWTDLNVKENGKELLYTVDEINPPAGYEKKVELFGTTYRITNTHTPATTEVGGSKVWNDANNQDGKRTAKVTVRLLADGALTATKEVTAADDWKFEFTNLPVYNMGKEIKYTVVEDSVAEYETEITNNGNVWTVKNSYIPETVKVSGTKTWDDNNNQDGVRPEKIVVKLWNGETLVASKEVTANDNWTWSFTGLPKYEKGQLINYTISEEVTENSVVTEDDKLGYTAFFTDPVRDTDGNIIINITNKYTPGETGVNVKKEWDDNDNQDGKRPASIQVRLYKTFEGENGVETAIDPVVTLNAENNWSYSWTKLPEKENGNTIVYKVKEVDVPDGYKVTVSGDMTMYIIVNTLIPELIDIAGTKTWKDNDNKLDSRPSEIRINLLADDEVIDTKTVTAADGWTWTFTDLPKYKAGHVEIVYKVTEDEVDGYTTTYTDNQRNVVNTLVGFTNVSGVKTWEDNDNQDGKRPLEVTIDLYADGVKKDSVTLHPNADGIWPEATAWSFDNLPKYTEEGVFIHYTVDEVITVPGYSAEITEDGIENRYIVNNKYNPEKTSRSVEKIWVDKDNQDGIRPDSIKVVLKGTVMQDGALKVVISDAATLKASDNAAENWKYTWNDLPVYNNGKVINYTVEEVSVKGYSQMVTGDMNFIVTNTHEPETVQYDVRKLWDDYDNQDGIRPDSVSFQIVEELAENEYSAPVGTVTLSAANGFKGTTGELPKYRDGKEIKYTLIEGKVEGYDSTVEFVIPDGFIAKNTHDPLRVKIKGLKIWNDNEDADGNRPKELVFELWKEVNGVHAFVDDRKIKASNNWEVEFNGVGLSTNGYPEFEKGTRIKYYIKEVTINNYVLNSEATSVNEVTSDAGKTIEITLQNDYQPEMTSRRVTKSWLDDNNRDGVRPDSIKVQLYSDKDMTKPYGDPVTLSESNNWSYEWKELPVELNGSEAEYTVAELKFNDAWETLYTTAYNPDDPFVIENTHTTATIDVEGAKTWNDENNRDGIRPASIEIRLYADGVPVPNGVKTVTAADDWKWSFTDLLKYENGKEIIYSIEEVMTAGTLAAELYESRVEGYNVINTYIPESIDIEGQKIWEDNDNAAGSRPASIVVNLLADGLVVDSKTVTAADNWHYAFTGLRKYLDGREIIYSVSEEQVEGYTPYVDGFNITNRYTPGYTYLTGNKVWNDGDNVDGLRPNAVTIRLYRDGEMIRTAQANISNNWTFMFTDLLVAAADGHRYVYTITEDGVMGYTSTINGTTVVNTHTPSTPPQPPVPPTPPTTPPDDNSDVLGSRRTRDVLGARRQRAVLGARRVPKTGDEAKMAAWAMAMSASAAACAAWFGFRRKEKK